MKKFSVSALCCVAACALCLGGCNKNADKGESCADKATCTEGAAKSGCCKDKAAGADAAGCCKNKAAATSN
jgi:hypothetical protein